MEGEAIFVNTIEEWTARMEEVLGIGDKGRGISPALRLIFRICKIVSGRLDWDT